MPHLLVNSQLSKGIVAFLGNPLEVAHLARVGIAMTHVFYARVWLGEEMKNSESSCWDRLYFQQLAVSAVS